MDVLVSARWNVEPDIQAAGFLYARDPYGQEQVTSFQSDNSLDGFVWKSETSGAVGRSGTEIIADKNDVITIRKFDVQPEEKSYQLSPAAIPNIFLQQVLSQMLDSGKKETVVDIIRPDGTIAPTFISRIESEDTAADEGAGYILEVGFLCEGGFSEQVYLDGKKQISKKVFRLETASVLERVAQEDIIREFPERADFILQKSNPLKLDSSQ